MISEEIFEIFKNLIFFQKISKFFEDQLWEDLTFFVFNRFWISFFIDRSEIPWRTRFVSKSLYKAQEKSSLRLRPPIAATYP